MLTNRRAIGLVAGILVVVLGFGAAAAVVGGQTGDSSSPFVDRGEPNIDASVPEPEIIAGTEAEIEIQLQNDGRLQSGDDRSAVTTARAVSATVADEGPFDVKSGTSSVGSIPDGETVAFTQRIKAPTDLEPGEYEITLEVDYSYTYQPRTSTDRSGSEDIDLTLVVPDEPKFGIENLEETLAVGYSGDVTGELTNDGTRSVDDAVLVVEPMSDSLFVEDTRYALPELDSGESSEFRYPMDVSGQADPGARQLRFTVEYTDDSRETQTSPAISQRVVIGDRRDEFSLETVNGTVRQGETADYILEITNNRPETLSNIDANLYTNNPLDSTNDEAYVPELQPNESATLRFDITAAGDASPELYPVELDFQYDTERGDTELSDEYTHPVEVEPGVDDDGIGLGTILPVVIGLVVVGGAGFALWRRQ